MATKARIPNAGDRDQRSGRQRRAARGGELECPRCQVVAIGLTRPRSRCSACGEMLVVAVRPTEKRVRAYLYGPGRLEPLPATDRIEERLR